MGVQQYIKVSQDWQPKKKEKKKKKKEVTQNKTNSKRFPCWDHVYRKVKSKKSSLSLGICSKLEPRYCGPSEVLANIGPVSYQLALPANIKVHDVFHVSLLKKYMHDTTHIID